MNYKYDKYMVDFLSNFIRIYPFDEYREDQDCNSFSYIPYAYDGFGWGGYNAYYDYIRSKFLSVYLASFLQERGIELLKEKEVDIDYSFFGQGREQLYKLFGIIWERVGISILCNEAVCSDFNVDEFLEMLDCDISETTDDISACIQNAAFGGRILAFFTECAIDEEYYKSTEPYLCGVEASNELYFVVPSYFDPDCFCFIAKHNGKTGIVSVIGYTNKIAYSGMSDTEEVCDLCSLTLSAILTRQDFLKESKKRLAL